MASLQRREQQAERLNVPLQIEQRRYGVSIREEGTGEVGEVGGFQVAFCEDWSEEGAGEGRRFYAKADSEVSCCFFEVGVWGC